MSLAGGLACGLACIRNYAWGRNNLAIGKERVMRARIEHGSETTDGAKLDMVLRLGMGYGSVVGKKNLGTFNKVIIRKHICMAIVSPHFQLCPFFLLISIFVNIFEIFFFFYKTTSKTINKL